MINFEISFNYKDIAYKTIINKPDATPPYTAEYHIIKTSPTMDGTEIPRFFKFNMHIHELTIAGGSYNLSLSEIVLKAIENYCIETDIPFTS